MLFILTLLTDGDGKIIKLSAKNYVKLPKRGKIPMKSPTNLILSALASEFLQRIQIQDFFFYLGGGGGGGGETGKGQVGRD